MTCLAPVALVLTVLVGSAPTEPLAVLVLDTEAAAGLDRERNEVARALVAALRLRREVRVVTAGDAADVRTALEKQGSRGCTTPACQAKLSKLAAARAALGSSLGKVGDAYVLTLTLVDAATVTVQGGTARSSPQVAGLIAQLESAVGDLFATGNGQTIAGPAARSRATTSYAVFDLQGDGIKPEAAASLTNVLAVTLKQLEGTTVVSRDDMQAMLQLKIEKSKLGCTDDTACLAEIGGALGVDRMITGSVGRLGEQFVVTLQALDVGSTAVVNRVSEAFAGQEDQLLVATRRAVRALLGVPEGDATGQLALSGSEPTSEVFVNEKPVGMLPLPPMADLEPGRYQLRIAKEGFFDWRSDVFVESGVTTAVWAQLSEEPLKWYQTWWVWTLAGVATASVAVGVVLLADDAPPARGTVTIP